MINIRRCYIFYLVNMVNEGKRCGKAYLWQELLYNISNMFSDSSISKSDIWALRHVAHSTYQFVGEVTNQITNFSASSYQMCCIIQLRLQIWNVYRNWLIQHILVTWNRKIGSWNWLFGWWLHQNWWVEWTWRLILYSASLIGITTYSSKQINTRTKHLKCIRLQLTSYIIIFNPVLDIHGLRMIWNSNGMLCLPSLPYFLMLEALSFLLFHSVDGIWLQRSEPGICVMQAATIWPRCVS